MYYAPIAVFGAFAFTIAQKGILIVSSIAWYVATVYVLLFLFTLIVFGTIGYLFKIKIKPLFKELAETLTLVYATAQGRACLAYAMAGLEKLGVPKKYYSFVLGVGFQFNLTGMAFFVGLTAVFAINANGLQLTFWQQLPLLMTLRLATIGGVNIGSLPLLLIILPQFNIAQSPIILLFGVDILMDMARSVVNMAGNCLASVAIAKWDNPKENAHL